jgi:uncharacterized membrane protein
MSNHAAITVLRPREEVERLWDTDVDGTVTFADAPGDRGTEIHVELGDGRLVSKLTRSRALAKAKDELRRFKQRVETGEIARSDSTPEGERAERKFKQRPAQPLEKAGV